MVRRFALLSDIHSNVGALDAVLADIATRHVGTVMNLGDILYGPIEPLATYRLLQQQDIITIRGNQDRQIYEATSDDVATNPTLAFILEDLGDEPIAWLKSLPPTAAVKGGIFACHGTPNDDLEYLLEDVSSGRPVVRDDDAIEQRLSDVRGERVVVCGHSHIARVVALTDGTIIVNPGSVGLPAYFDDEPSAHTMEAHSPHASYAILELEQDREPHVEIHRVSYDHRSASDTAFKRHRPDWAMALATGRANAD